MTEYDAVFQWNMTNDEIEAFRLALCYQQEFRRVFADEHDGEAVRKNSLPRRGDPRKSNLFKHCWKLRRETRGLLQDAEYQQYIKGNLMILKIQKGYVGPNVICGDKAWVRYKVWKRHYDRKLAEANAVPPPPSVSGTDPKIIQQLDRTKKFMFERCDGVPTPQKYREFAANGGLKVWAAMGKMSQYYAVLSPFVCQAVDIEQLGRDCSFSPALIREKCTEEVQNYFRHEFAHEMTWTG